MLFRSFHMDRHVWNISNGGKFQRERYICTAKKQTNVVVIVSNKSNKKRANLLMLSLKLHVGLVAISERVPMVEREEKHPSVGNRTGTSDFL